MLVFAFVTALWATQGLTGMNTTVVCLLGAGLLFLPVFGVMGWEDANKGVSWQIVLISGGGISLGDILMRTGAAKWLADAVFHHLGLAGASALAVLLVMLVLQFMHVLFVGTAAMATALLPIVLGIAQTAGIPPLVLARHPVEHRRLRGLCRLRRHLLALAGVVRMSAGSAAADGARQVDGLLREGGGEPVHVPAPEPVRGSHHAQRPEKPPVPPKDRCCDRRRFRVALAQGHVQRPRPHPVVQRPDTAGVGGQHAPSRAAVERQLGPFLDVVADHPRRMLPVETDAPLALEHVKGRRLTRALDQAGQGRADVVREVKGVAVEHTEAQRGGAEAEQVAGVAADGAEAVKRGAQAQDGAGTEAGPLGRFRKRQGGPAIGERLPGWKAHAQPPRPVARQGHSPGSVAGQRRVGGRAVGGRVAADVVVSEVGPRDGLQSIRRFMPTAAKHRWIAAPGCARSRWVPSSPKLLPQMADADEVVRGAVKLPGVAILALVPNLKGAQRAVAAGTPKLTMPVSAPRSHSLSSIGMTPEQAVAEVGRVCALRDDAMMNGSTHNQDCFPAHVR